MRLQPELRITEFPRRFLLSQPANASNPRCSAVTIYAISVEAAAVELRAPITGTAVRRPLGRRDRALWSGVIACLSPVARGAREAERSREDAAFRPRTSWNYDSTPAGLHVHRVDTRRMIGRAADEA